MHVKITGLVQRWRYSVIWRPPHGFVLDVAPSAFTVHFIDDPKQIYQTTIRKEFAHP
jgi:hypothetical protein